jgi:hypothetical protein
LRTGWDALEDDDVDAHELLSWLLESLNVGELQDAAETLTITAVGLLADLRRDHPGLDIDDWLTHLGLHAAGASR